jgi:hypothetical protein
MKMKQKTLLSLFIIFVCHAYSQNTQPPPPPGLADLPVDGGIFLLIATAIIYGVKKTRN